MGVFVATGNMTSRMPAAVAAASIVVLLVLLSGTPAFARKTMMMDNWLSYGDMSTAGRRLQVGMP